MEKTERDNEEQIKIMHVYQWHDPFCKMAVSIFAKYIVGCMIHSYWIYSYIFHLW